MPFIFHSSEPAIQCSSSADGEREALDALEEAASAFREDNTTLVRRVDKRFLRPARATRITEPTLPSVIVAAEPLRALERPAASSADPTMVSVRRRGPTVALWLLAAVVAVFAVRGVPLVGAAVDGAFGAFGALEGARTSAR